MYPFTGDRTYVRNSWYVAAVPSEIDAGPVERIILDSPVAIFRMQDGSPAAMWGVCPHRYYPLALGKVVGDALQCNYHGFQFDGRTGACAKIPSQETTAGTFRQRIFPCVEHGPWIWIWPGDPERADEALLPSIEEIGAADGWRVDIVEVMPTAGRAQLIIENLMDLTHVAFLHGESIDGSALLTPDIKITEDDGVVRATRITPTPWLGEYYDLLFGSQNRYGGVKDVMSGTYYFSPGYIITLASIILGEAVDRNVFGRMYFHHAVTPETASSCHYFAAASRDYRLDDDTIGEALRQLNQYVGHQDVAAVGEVERRLRRFPPDQPELLCRADAAAIRVRRRIQAQMDEESRLEAAAKLHRQEPG